MQVIETLKNDSKFRFKIYNLFWWRENIFIKMILLFTILAAIAHPYPHIAMWVGFMFAGYSAIANDSIQTIGTFIASNAQRPWWHLWLYTGIIFVATCTVSWFLYDGDVSYQRLTSKGFSEAPQEFQFLQLAAPLILLMLTRLRMPVSTTFLLLSAFSSSASGIVGVASKSFNGYFVAFGTSLVIFTVLAKPMKKLVKGQAHAFWMPLQWVISGSLWSVWIMQDAANIAVFLPRSLSVGELIGFVSFIFFGLGMLFFLKGDKIQQIVSEKSEITDVRGATIVDLIYTFILIYFKQMSNVPMSTTWVFLGLLGGREIAMRLTSSKSNLENYLATFKMVGRDVLFALIGLSVSVALAISINPVIQDEILQFFER